MTYDKVFNLLNNSKLDKKKGHYNLSLIQIKHLLK